MAETLDSRNYRKLTPLQEKLLEFIDGGVIPREVFDKIKEMKKESKEFALAVWEVLWRLKSRDAYAYPTLQKSLFPKASFDLPDYQNLADESIDQFGHGVVKTKDIILGERRYARDN